MKYSPHALSRAMSYAADALATGTAQWTRNQLVNAVHTLPDVIAAYNDLYDHATVNLPHNIHPDAKLPAQARHAVATLMHAATSAHAARGTALNDTDLELARIIADLVLHLVDAWLRRHDTVPPSPDPVRPTPTDSDPLRE